MNQRITWEWIGKQKEKTTLLNIIKEIFNPPDKKIDEKFQGIGRYQGQIVYDLAMYKTKKQLRWMSAESDILYYKLFPSPWLVREAKINESTELLAGHYFPFVAEPEKSSSDFADILNIAEKDLEKRLKLKTQEDNLAKEI